MQNKFVILCKNCNNTNVAIFSTVNQYGMSIESLFKCGNCSSIEKVEQNIIGEMALNQLKEKEKSK